jgi:predicted DNA-binding protein
MSTEKHARTIRLTPDIYDRLNALCDHLGVTPNAYIIQAIGKAISQDEMAFKIQQNQSDMFAKLALMMDEAKDKE